MTLSYANLPRQDSLAPDAVFVAYWDGSRWQYLGGAVDPQQQTVKVKVDHFSLFGLFTLPSLDTLFSQLKNILCTPSGPRDDHWSQLVSSLKQVNTSAIPMPAVSVYENNNLFTFAAYGNCIIYADNNWYAHEAAWLPEAKRDLFGAAIIGHELSHIVRGRGHVDLTAQVLKDAAQKHTVAEFMAEYGAALQVLWFEIKREDPQAASAALQTFLKTFLLNLEQNAKPDTCAQLQQLEFNADLDGANWAGRALGDTNAVGLVIAHFWQVDTSVAGCTHPSGTTRAQEIRSGLAMGSNGGLLGKVTIQGAPASDVEIAVDNRPTGRTDRNGQFLITGLAVGSHSVTFSKPGYQGLNSQPSVPFQDLAFMSVDLSPLVEVPPTSLPPTATWTPVPPQPTRTFTPRPTATFTPRLPTATFPPSSQSITVRVSATADWQSYGVTLQPGNILRIQYISDLWSPWPGGWYDGNGVQFDPQGARIDCRTETTDNSVIGGVCHASLIGRVGAGPPFYLGNSYNQIPGGSGTIYLRINDKRQSDNDGSIVVMITVAR